MSTEMERLLGTDAEGLPILQQGVQGGVPQLPEPGAKVVRVSRADLGVQGGVPRPAGKRKRVADRTWSLAGFSSWGGPRGRHRQRRRGLAR